MSEKEKAIELVSKFYNNDLKNFTSFELAELEAKQCALICADNEYKSNRELLFNLRSCGMIRDERIYLVRLSNLIDEEEKVKQEINNL